MIARANELVNNENGACGTTPRWGRVPRSGCVRWAITTGTQGGAESRVIQAYLGSANRASMSRHHAPLVSLIHCVALADYLRHIGCRIEGAANIVDHPHRYMVDSLNLTMVETSPGRREPVPEQGLIFIRRPSGERLVLKLENDPFGPGSGSCFTVIDAHGWGGVFLDGWQEYTVRHAYLRGKAFYATGELVAVDPLVQVDDVLMEPNVRRLVDRLVLSFPEQVRRFRHRGLSAKRGVILEGPPGTGKTMLCRALCNQLKCTFIWLTSRHMCRDSSVMTQAWMLARLLSPTVILLEDLDLIAESRDTSYHGFLLGELMNQMDGVEDNDGILTIATTNHIEVIEKAIRNRPGRFDHAVRFGSLNEDGRRKLLNRHLRDGDLEEGVLERLVCETSGYTGARLVDLIKTLVECAIEEPGDEDDFRMLITMEMLDGVLSEAGTGRERDPVGFMTERKRPGRSMSRST